MIGTITDTASRELLARNKTGRLGCVLTDGRPYVVPVNYLYHEGDIYVHSLPGQKISAMDKRPSVCIQTDRISSDGFSWSSVIAYGEFEIVSNATEKGRILSLFFKVFPGFTPVEAKLNGGDTSRESIVFRIRIQELTGVCEGS